MPAGSPKDAANSRPNQPYTSLTNQRPPCKASTIYHAPTKHGSICTQLLDALDVGYAIHDSAKGSRHALLA
eukprot:1194878-Prorocentrum_minimum.AAC.2